MNRSLLIPTCVFFVWLAVLHPGRAVARQTQTPQQGQNQQQNQQQDQSRDQLLQTEVGDVLNFRGKVTKKEGKYYLEDHIQKQNYLLDDNWLAKRHLNDNVLVKGVLVQDKNLIHVRSIVKLHQ
jgi:hypothetical protein